MTKDPKLHIIHILECIQDINDFIEGIEFEDFIDDKKTYNAVLRSLQTLSESTKFIEPNIRESNPQICWKDIWGFRNILVHDYLGTLTPEIIWNIIGMHLPELEKTLLQHCPELSKIRK